MIESPRWLIGRGRVEEAQINLNKLRKQRDIDSGETAVEIEEIRIAVELSKTSEKGRWVDLFNRTYRYRTFIIVMLFFYYEVTYTLSRSEYKLMVDYRWTICQCLRTHILPSTRIGQYGIRLFNNWSSSRCRRCYSRCTRYRQDWSSTTSHHWCGHATRL